MSTETITTISPTTNTPVATRTGVTPEKLHQLAESAQAAFHSFSQSTTLEQRQQIVSRALDILEKKKDVLAKEVTEQMGRPISYTPVEVLTSVKRGRFLNRISSSVLGEEGVVHGDAEEGFNRYIKRKPVGVSLVIFAWNVGCLALSILRIHFCSRLSELTVYTVSLLAYREQCGPRHSLGKCSGPETFPSDPQRR